jgi:hypothetical protein
MKREGSESYLGALSSLRSYGVNPPCPKGTRAIASQLAAASATSSSLAVNDAKHREARSREV